MQDVFLQLYIKRTDIEDTIHLSGYLHTLLRNKIIDRFRQQLSHKKHHSYLTQNQPSTVVNMPEADMDVKMLEGKINDAIEQLPEKCREVFLLSRSNNLSHQAIAKKLAISVSTVEKHIVKALKIMRERVEKHQLNSMIIILLYIHI